MFFLLTVRSKESKAVTTDGSLFGVLSEKSKSLLHPELRAPVSGWGYQTDCKHLYKQRGDGFMSLRVATFVEKCFRPWDAL